MAKPSVITLKELHGATGEIVRRTGRAREAVLITEHGEPIAGLVPLALVPLKPRKRVLLPGFEEYMARTALTPVRDSIEDLDWVRGERL